MRIGTSALEGAVGDGKAKDTAAFQAALDACAAGGGGVVEVPAGNYLIGSIVLKSNTTLHLDKDAVLNGSPDVADYPLTDIRWEGRDRSRPSRSHQRHGRQHNRHRRRRPHRRQPGSWAFLNPRGPVLIEPINCSDVHFENFSTHYSTLWSIHPTYCQNVTACNLNIRSTGGNGDGIDVDSCQHVTIENCDIDTGDDCVAIKSGRGLDAYKMAKPCSDITITHCTLGDSIFACVGIGSETSGGVSNVTVEHCKFTHAFTFAIYIKSHVGRGAGISDVKGDDLQVLSATGGFLRLNLLNSGRTDTGAQAVAGDEGIPFGRQFSFSNVQVAKCGRLVDATLISPQKCVDGLTLSNITGTCQKGMQLCNIVHADLSGISVSGFSGALLATNNVTGKGLDGAAPYRSAPATGAR